MKKSDVKEVAEVAAQIVYEYPDWNEAHVNDIMRTYAEVGEIAPCDGDQLYVACNEMQKVKDSGLSYFDAITEVTKTLTAIKIWEY